MSVQVNGDFFDPDTPLRALICYLEEMKKHIGKDNNGSETLRSLVNKSSLMALGMYGYLSKMTTPESEQLKELGQRSQNADWNKFYEDGKTTCRLPACCLTGHVEGQFLKSMVTLVKAKNVLEIGMFTGYASLAMAEAVPEDGRVVTCEIEPFLVDFAKQTFNKSPHGRKIEIMLGPASESLKQLIADKCKFDFIFIDADKQGYLNYYKTIMDEQLLSEDGCICIDNALFKGEVFLGPSVSTKDGEALADFNEYVKNDNRVEQVLLPLRDGVMIIRHKKS